MNRSKVAEATSGEHNRLLRRLTAVFAAVVLFLSGYFIAHVSPDSDWLGDLPLLDQTFVETPDEQLIVPDTATYLSTERDSPTNPRPARLPVGVSEDFGISVAHIYFSVDETMLRPESEIRLRLPISQAPEDSDKVTVEIASVRPTDCPCQLNGSSPPPYGNVWQAKDVSATDTEVTFDITGAFDAPGRYGFAVSTPDTDRYLEFNGSSDVDRGPVLRTWHGVEIPQPPDDSIEAIPERGQSSNVLNSCSLGEKLVPTCGMLDGVAAGAHTNIPRPQSLHTFEERVSSKQDIYHAYERADERLFPAPEQIELARDPDNPRLLFINWKPRMASWASIAEGNAEVDAYLDRLAKHINENFPEPFFFTVHHEPENDVRPESGSGWEASDYAAMYRYVIEYLRDKGVDNLVTVMNYMAYMEWVDEPWHHEIYPGDDVIDWVGWSAYGLADRNGYSDDLTDLVNRPDPIRDWPGYYEWTVKNHPEKPIMLGEWGVFRDDDYPDHQREVFERAKDQLAHYPRLKAMVYFESPNAEGRNSEVHNDPDTLEAYKELMRSPYFDVDLD
ncbi:glycosyl hydrolase [Haloglycomyces albus]|uniref:glycosyl hydrolase n=1 Tax=Haloglycomyces albus TaxID=526067 RepID=UPI00046D46F7|nr:glycosyl hydrolase [Haloglycomyces albus]